MNKKILLIIGIIAVLIMIQSKKATIFSEFSTSKDQYLAGTTNFDSFITEANIWVSENRIVSLPPTAEILFASNRDTGSRRQEIYSMNSDGGNQKRLTYTEEHHFVTGIDSSRRYMVSSRAEEDTHSPSGLGDEDKRALWIIDLETKQEKRLTDINNHAEGKTFSPDGEWIVFVMRPPGINNPMDVYRIKRDGTELTQLTNTPPVSEGDPSWSNDGTRIAFISIDADNPYFILKTMDIDGNNIQTIYDNKGAGEQIGDFWARGVYDPAWSPDDEWIVVESPFENTGGNFGSGNWHILKIRSDGSQVIDLSELGGHTDRGEYLPSFSPDGNWIIFGSIHEAEPIEESFSDIFKMDAETGIATRLTYNPASYMMPIWIR